MKLVYGGMRAIEDACAAEIGGDDDSFEIRQGQLVVSRDFRIPILDVSQVNAVLLSYLYQSDIPEAVPGESGFITLRLSSKMDDILRFSCS